MTTTAFNVYSQPRDRFRLSEPITAASITINNIISNYSRPGGTSARVPDGHCRNGVRTYFFVFLFFFLLHFDRNARARARDDYNNMTTTRVIHYSNNIYIEDGGGGVALVLARRRTFSSSIQMSTTTFSFDSYTYISSSRPPATCAIIYIFIYTMYALQWTE